MSKIIIPDDRTQKQPVRAFCRNIECLANSGEKRFEFDVNADHDQITCPKCGATEAPMVGVLSLVHFLHRNKDGKIKGMGGLMYQLACDEKRVTLATHTNDEAATDQLSAVNCPGCLAAAKEKKLKDKQGLSIDSTSRFPD